MATIHLPPVSPSTRDLPEDDGPAGAAGAPRARASRALAILSVTALAFLLASFPARNADVWLHLAAGRSAIAAGAADPFATIDGLALVPGAGRGWLYNLLAYALYAAAGGAGLVFVKALAVAATAALMLHLGRSGVRWWLPATCAALALLAMSPRLQLQPATISYLLLALTLGLLRRPEARDGGRWSWLPDWRLLVVFVVWANTDRWFVLGLGAAALAWAGEVLDRLGRGERPGLSRRAAWLAVLAGACLLNPTGPSAFAGPGESGWLALVAHETAGAARPAASPFQAAYFAGAGTTPAGLAYYALLGLGLLSFTFRLRSWSWQWFLPWAGLAALSAADARAVPFFAVLAGPVLAWNGEHLLARRFPAGERGYALWALGTASVGWLAGLLMCAWPGWLQGPPFGLRRWAVEPAPALEAGARAVAEWQRAGKLGPDARGLHLTPETAAAFAWFCPEVKGQYDNRLAASLGAAGEKAGDWPQRLRAAGVDYVVVYDADRKRLVATLVRLRADPGQWPLLAVAGDLAVFGWRDPARAPAPDPFAGLELDVDRLAFGAGTGERAPARPPGREPGSRRWWEALWKRAAPRTIDRDAAALHLLHAEALRQLAPYRHLAEWEASQAAALAGAAPGWAGAPPAAGLHDAALRLTLFQPQVPDADDPAGPEPAVTRQVHAWQSQFFYQRDDTPAALLYLAVRAARRAVAADPDDAQAHLVLGDCYLRLLHNTRERAWGRRFPELAELRRAQAAAALYQAVALRPDLTQAHLQLGALFTELGCADLALKHRRAYLDLVLKAGPSADVDPAEFRKAAARAERELNLLAVAVLKAEDEFAKESAAKRVSDRAELAARKGLVAKALEVLLASDLAAFGAHGLRLELDLLLRTGRVKEVREWMDPEQREVLGPGRYHWLRARALAASGDYAAAREECEQLAGAGRAVSAAGEREHELMARLVGQAVLDGCPAGRTAADALWLAGRESEFRSRMRDLAGGLMERADVAVLQGLLALEAGDVPAAAESFRQALRLGGDGRSGAALDFTGRPVAAGCLEWLE